MQVHINVLGPMTAHRDGHPVTLGGRRQRLVLAALLVADGRVVPTDRLHHLVWSDGTPTASRATLHGYIAALRRALEPHHPARTGQLLVREDPGYALRLPPTHTDTHRFTTLVTRAHTLRRQGHPTAAATTAHTALTLWRGPAYAGLDTTPFLQPEITRWNTLHTTATELHLAALVDAGHATTALADLQALVTRHPTRERPWELLALAQHRAGRPADALATLRQAHTHLTTHTGLDPGPTLQRLRTAILHHHEHLPTP
ncbi:AfsR/SARP family transcriptional regulator [Micromonospora okii]|uniref:AfsR/SARP family transcriptional regulator n=1 Tax=Micromonospora okii TaxID=1182970 RepID=UPI001E3125D2|nr:AfsR/SARP family transcriptional regulator [Micromonospora okii]